MSRKSEEKKERFNVYYYKARDDEGMSYDSDEGGYQDEVYHTSEVFEDEIAPHIENEDLRNDISDSLINKRPCHLRQPQCSCVPSFPVSSSPCKAPFEASISLNRLLR
ncbi:HEPN-associated N-terminal domain-containing protein [Chloroflexota bacterium]